MTLSTLDKTLYEYIRLQLVQGGYLPDITQFSTEEAYKAAKTDINDGGSNVIELFGVGPSKAREGKSECVITIDRSNIIGGRIGAFGSTYSLPATFDVDNNPLTYTKYKRPAKTFDVPYNIRYYANTSQYDYVIQNLILSCFSTMSFIVGLKNDSTHEFEATSSILIIFEDVIDVSTKDGLERIMRYRIKDVWLEDDKAVASSVPINSINFKIWTFESGVDMVSENKQDEVILDTTNGI